jgi:hypothetical protein
MKTIIFALVVALCAPAAFASSKICFGTGDAKGDRFQMIDLSKDKVTIDVDGSNFIGAGTFTRDNPDTVKGKDGINYLAFDLGACDGANSLLVDPALLNSGTTGKVKVRNRGEGFFNYVYFCRDNK